MNLTNIEELREKMKKYSEESFEEGMNQLVFQGYHYTRVLDIKEIINEGIEPLSEKTVEKIKNNMKRIYSGESYSIERIFQVFKERKLKDLTSGTISFSANEKQANRRNGRYIELLWRRMDKRFF